MPKPAQAYDTRARWMVRIAIGVAIAAIVLALMACSEPTAISPISGKPATSEQLTAEFEREKAEAERTARAEAVKQEQELARLAREAELRIQTLDLDQQREALALKAELDERVQGVIARALASREEREARMASLMPQYQGALDAIESELQRREQTLGVLTQVAQASGVPWLVAGAGVLASFGSLVVGRKKAIEANQIKTAAHRVVDSFDVLKASNPEFARILKDNAALLNEWQGEAGKRLVDQAQTAS